MDARDEALGLFADGLGIGPDHLNSFAGRKTFQKAIYLLQEGPRPWDMGFRYNLYIRGPYSPQLAEAGYGLLDDPVGWKAVRKHKQLVSTAQHDVDRLREEFASDRGGLDGDLLELAATHHFLIHQTYRYVSNPNEKRRKSEDWIREHKPDLAGKLTEAIDKLKRLKMID